MLILIKILEVVGRVFYFAIIGRFLLSWVSPGRERSTPIGRLLHAMTEPIVNVARMFPHKIGMIDLSLIMALFGMDIFIFVIKELLMRFMV